MATYRLKIPAWHRFEGPVGARVRREYREGDLLELSPEEYTKLRFSVEGPVEASPKAETVAAGGADKAKRKIGKAKDRAAVQDIRIAESRGRGRKTVLAAADERLGELGFTGDRIEEGKFSDEPKGETEG